MGRKYYSNNSTREDSGAICMNACTGGVNTGMVEKMIEKNRRMESDAGVRS